MRPSILLITALALLWLQWELWRRSATGPPPPGGSSTATAEAPPPDLQDLGVKGLSALVLTSASGGTRAGALAEIHLKDMAADLDTPVVERLIELSRKGSEPELCGAGLVLLDRSYPLGFPVLARLFDSTRHPLTRALLLREAVRQAPGHEDVLAGDPSRLAKKVAVWLGRGEVPGLPPGFARYKKPIGSLREGPWDPDARPVPERNRSGHTLRRGPAPSPAAAARPPSALPGSSGAR